VLSNDYNRVLNTKESMPFSTNDHSPLYFDVLYKLPTARAFHFASEFNRADWAQIKMFLNNVNFLDLLHGDFPLIALSKTPTISVLPASKYLCRSIAVNFPLNLAQQNIHTASGENVATKPGMASEPRFSHS
jgi:hypothetical protein